MARQEAGRQGPGELTFDALTALAGALPDLVRGAAVTMGLMAVVTVCGTVLSVASAAALRSRNPALRRAVGGYVELVRNTPFLVQLFFIFFGLPRLGFRISNTAAAIAAMTLNMTAYGTEVVRAGLDAVPAGQWEAGAALGLGRLRVFLSVVLPQALRVILPALTSQSIIIMLESAVVSQIAVRDLTYEADVLQARTFLAFPTYLTAAMIYLALAVLMRRMLGAVAGRYLARGHA